MSFLRYIHKEIMNKCNDQFEVIRIINIIVNNILENPGLDKYKRIRMVNITTISSIDKDLLVDILVFIGFKKIVENLEEFMILINSNRLPAKKDLDYLINEVKDTQKFKTVDNTEIVKNFLKNKEDNSEKIMKQFQEDREDFNEKWKRFMKK